jgi:predicted nucleic acid-binding protein
MRVLLDTNIILDHILKRPPQWENAKKIFELIYNDEISGCMTANTVTDIFYIAKKHIGDKAAREILHLLLTTLFVIEVDGNDCLNALMTEIPDFEDALVLTCAEKDMADFVITRDEEMQKLSFSGVKLISSENFLKRYQESTM